MAPHLPPASPAGRFDGAVEDFERNGLVHALEQTGWNQSNAAKLLGMSFRAIRYRVKKHGLGRCAAGASGRADDADAPRQRR